MAKVTDAYGGGGGRKIAGRIHIDPIHHVRLPELSRQVHNCITALNKRSEMISVEEVHLTPFNIPCSAGIARVLTANFESSLKQGWNDELTRRA
jgi:hypothetical protein